MSSNKKILRGYIYSLPSLIIIEVIVVFPILYTFYISFTNMNVYHWFEYDFVGFKNYNKAIFIFDSGFGYAFIRTILWTIVNMVLQLLIAFILASLLNIGELKLRRIYKTLLMFPWAMPGYISILLWKMGMFNTEYGLINKYLSFLAIDKINWLSNTYLAFISSVLVNLWLALPFMIMIIDGGLQSIDKAYYESAILEGANAYDRAVKITIPLLKPIIAPAVIITIFTTFKQFDIIYLLTMQQGSKTGADIHTLITYTYEKAFVTNNYGYSSAVAVIIFLILVISTILAQKEKKVENE